jgi:hypothetical protein
MGKLMADKGADGGQHRQDRDHDCGQQYQEPDARRGKRDLIEERHQAVDGLNLLGLLNRGSGLHGVALM